MIPPLNPLDPERSQMYIYNNIFFSHAMDVRDFCKDIGGDRAAYIASNNDLKGVIAYNNVDIDELHTLLTAIIDYRGHRLIAQSIIPGKP
jgi:protein TIF31